jgi:hypothetical protein
LWNYIAFPIHAPTLEVKGAAQSYLKAYGVDRSEAGGHLAPKDRQFQSGVSENAMLVDVTGS